MSTSDLITRLPGVVAAMKQAHLSDGPADAEQRRDRLARAERLLSDNRAQLESAIRADYGHRSPYQTLATDVLAPIKSMRHAREQLEHWMRPEAQDAGMPGVQARVEYQPLGVVGIISPWNFPINLSFGPLAGVFAAGNRALLKPSELTPRTSDLLAEQIPRYFDALEFGVVLGDAEVGAAFTAQPFDHLIYTGSTAVGRLVMRAASENLVPVTLELGGKSPVLVDVDADIKIVAERVLTSKTFNAGQICIAPDYVLLPPSAREAFIEHARAFVAATYPDLGSNTDYTAVVNDRHFQRLQVLLDDAQAKGATVISLAPDGEADADPATRLLAPTLVLDPDDTMRVMQEQIFGPVLPLVNCPDLDHAIDYVNAHPRPLAAYYFGSDATRQKRFTERTTSGAAVINDTLIHAFIEDLPFGGIGPSGIGAYHGIHGFRRFSHAKAVVMQSPDGTSSLALRAPYADKQKAVEAQLSE